MRIAGLLLLLLLTACNSTPSAVNEGTISRATDQPKQHAGALPTPDTARAKAVSAQRDTLRIVRERRNFSRPAGPADLFQLVFRGASVLAGTGEFTITDPNGQVIFREMLTGADLEAALVYELRTPTATPAARIAFVQRRIDQFFQPAQFHVPAIDRQAAFPAHVANLDQTIWNDLQQRPDAVRFDYLKGKEDRRQLVWSPLKKQTVRLR